MAAATELDTRGAGFGPCSGSASSEPRAPERNTGLAVATVPVG